MGRTPMRQLSNDQLLINLRELLRRERRLTIAVIEYLGEVEHRRVHLALGYSSMFYFCTRGLGYSESAANRRLRAARCLRRFPQIAELLRSRSLTLSVLCVVATDLTPDNCDRLLERVSGKSTRDAINLLADLRPIRRTRERIRPVAVLARTQEEDERDAALFAPRVRSRRPEVAGSSAPGAVTDNGAARDVPSAGLNTDRPEKASEECSDACRCSGGKLSCTSALTPDKPSGPVERRYTFEFAGTEDFLRKYQRVAALYSRRRVGRLTIETVFEGLMDDYIHRNDPERRIERRRLRAQARMERRTDSATATDTAAHIPAARRDEVHRRDGYRCTYVSPDGKRCENTYNLQIDHVQPRALGGGNELSNLRLLCAAHNRFVAEKVFGRAHMERFTRDKK